MQNQEMVNTMTNATNNNKSAANAKAEKIFSIADIAEITGQEPKKIRRILRNAIPAENQPGKGRSWAIRASQLDAVKALIAKGASRELVFAELPITE